MATLMLSDKNQIITTVVLHFVILSSLGEISQFRDGLLKIEGMQEMLGKYPDLLESFYCNKEVPLTSGLHLPMCIIIISLFIDLILQMFTSIRFSPKGTNMRDCEEAAYMFFVNYLEDCERESNKFHVLDYLFLL